MKRFLLRLFAGENFKGEKGYLRTQRKFALAQTCLYFGISLLVFGLGLWSTKTKANLLTIVAILGCLPASKSLVETIMFYRFRGCSPELETRLSVLPDGIVHAYDRVFTSERKNYNVAHLVIHAGEICGITEEANFDENAFRKHLDTLLKADSLKDYTIKIFTDPDKYIARISDLSPEEDPARSLRFLKTILAVSL